MVDPVSITLLAGITTLLIERLFKWLEKLKKSKCCGSELVFFEECRPDVNSKQNHRLNN